MIDAQEVLRSTRKVEITVELTGKQAAAMLWWCRFELRRAGSRDTPRLRATHRIAEQLCLAAAERVARLVEERT